MASMAKPLGTMPIDDPFVTHPTPEQRHRYSIFDSQQFSSYANGSPAQVRRALEAHLAETQRRLDDAGRVGQILVKQRAELESQLNELQSPQNDDEIPLEMRQKVAQLEREVAEISRETARIYVPKRVPSGENATDAANASVLSSQAQASPSKIHAPISRKARNQPPTRKNDVELAAALTDTLLIQIRELQGVLAEKDESLRVVTAEKAELDADFEHLQKRLKELDESEQRFKDENWSLETQVSELLSSQKDLVERELRLQQTLKATSSQKDAMEHEFEELKQSHNKLAEDHSAARKIHDAELNTFRRNATSNESEVTAMRKKVEDLTHQNKELAKAFTARLRGEEQSTGQEFALLEGVEDDEQVTPDNSPPASPSKATPRHGGLESETLKTSLHHAQRMIQHLKNTIHREKTEKFELKKMLQDARDEIETKRKASDSAGKKRNSKQLDSAKKGRPDRLGASRGTTDEIIMDDPEWEDHEGLDTPSKPPTRREISEENEKAALEPPSIATRASHTDHTTDAYVTATENSDAFETANEQGTETEAFQTGVESIEPDSEGDLTETEHSAADHTLRKKPSALNRMSFQSTASTSEDSDEYDDYQLQTPIAQQGRFKVRMSRAGYRKASSPRTAENSFTSFNDVQSELRDSPASVASSSGTPVQGKSLFAELGEFSDGETDASGTPQSTGARSSRFNSPEAVRKTTVPSKLRESHETIPAMADMATMTDDLPEPPVKSAPSLLEAAGLGIAGALVGAGVEHQASEHAKEPEIKIEYRAPPQNLNKSLIKSQSTEPIAAPTIAPKSVRFVQSVLVSQHSEPVAPVVVEPKLSAFNPSSIISQETEPLAPITPVAVVPVPIPEPEPEMKPENIILKASSIMSQATEPQALVVQLKKTAITSQGTEPIAAPSTPIPQLISSSFVHQHTPPVEAEQHIPILGMAAIKSLHTAPVTPEPIIPESVLPAVSYPVSKEPQFTEPILEFSDIMTQDSAPVFGEKADEAFGVPSIHPVHSKSTIMSQETRPMSAIAPAPVLVAQASQAAITPSKSSFGRFGSVFKRSRDKSEPIIVAEDSTSSERGLAADSTPGSSHGDSRVPFQAVDGNAQAVLAPASENMPAADITNESTQTVLSAKDMDRLLKSSGSRDIPAAQIAGNTSPRKSRDPIRRPGSAGSNRSGFSPPPPLPAEAKQVIAAQRASLQSSGSDKAAAPGAMPPPPIAMGPPLMPASAYKRNHGTATIFRPSTPVGGRKVGANSSAVRSGMSSPATRRSSVSSFASELDERFNIGQGGNMGMSMQGTDPKMLRALTTTMLGAWLWKYKGKTSRHKRFFWVHPYTLALYWSKEQANESLAKKGKANSVAIVSVQEVHDDNQSPPGLHHQSIVVFTPARQVKLTAETAETHKIWINALSYLLLRQSGNEAEEEDDITADDLADFDPNVRSSSRTTHRSRVSQMSYASRTTASSRHYPTLRPTAQMGSTVRSQSAQPHASFSSRISQVFRTPQASLRSRSSVASTVRHIPETSTGAEISERSSTDNIPTHSQTTHTRDPLRMENVRACCDGKHDVGQLPRERAQVSVGGLASQWGTAASRYKRASFHPSTTSSLAGSTTSSHKRANSESRRERRLMEKMDPASIVESHH
ncbi:hypothetical protein BT63DRAFT_32763 [Microthyrium microscopicum]|uniref:PH domain-containing protein n=1 Tax=Microthyrium microscopicum TaxID=703497 RepID=A0A6A6UT03_9PEZI|nr:hypothetical protein BT63DRAFT_32763 [Microthyrium microscopicum]